MSAELDPALITTPTLGREGLSRTQITRAERVSPLCVRIPRWARTGCAELAWNLGSSAEPLEWCRERLGFSPSGRDHSSQHSWGFIAMPDKSWQRSTT